MKLRNVLATMQGICVLIVIALAMLFSGVHVDPASGTVQVVFFTAFGIGAVLALVLLVTTTFTQNYESTSDKVVTYSGTASIVLFCTLAVTGFYLADSILYAGLGLTALLLVVAIGTALFCVVRDTARSFLDFCRMLSKSGGTSKTRDH